MAVYGALAEEHDVGNLLAGKVGSNVYEYFFFAAGKYGCGVFGSVCGCLLRHFFGQVGVYEPAIVIYCIDGFEQHLLAGGFEQVAFYAMT